MVELPALATALAGTIFQLGGVPVSVTGNYSVLPMQPDASHMEVVWPTSQMAMYTSVLMADGTRWQVPRVPRRLADGSVTLSLKSPASPSAVTYTIPKAMLDIPIWWVGEVVPPGEVEETNPGVPVEGPPADPDVPPTTPVEPPQPPAEG